MPTKPRKPLKWLYPTGVERDYARELRGVARQIQDAVEEHVAPVLPQLRLDDVRDIPESTGWYERLRQAFVAAIGVISFGGLPDRVERIARSLNRFNRAQLHKIVRSAYRVDIFRTEPWLADALKPWEAENIKLIRSIPQQALDRMHGKIVNAVREGKSLRDLRDILRKEYGITRRRAELIARDQVGKLNGQLTQIRQKEVGVTQYRWRGVLDSRERPEHVAREGRVYDWDNPPDDGHPGEPISCRCSAEPVLPLLEDLPGLKTSLPEREFSQTVLAGQL